MFTSLVGASWRKGYYATLACSILPGSLIVRDAKTKPDGEHLIECGLETDNYESPALANLGGQLSHSSASYSATPAENSSVLVVLHSSHNCH